MKTRLAILFFGLLFVGCAKSTPPPAAIEEPDPTPTAYEHTVSFSGETLGLIARWYTGRSDNWPKLAEANPGLNAHRISLGQKILIPTEIMVTTEPLPRRVLPAAQTTPAAKTTELEAPDSTEKNPAQLDTTVDAAEAKTQASSDSSPASAAEQPEDNTKVSDEELLLRELLAEDTAAREAATAQGPVPRAEREQLLNELLK